MYMSGVSRISSEKFPFDQIRNLILRQYRMTQPIGIILLWLE